MDEDIPVPRRRTWLRSRKFQFLAIAGLFLIYLVGIVVRSRQGIHVTVWNSSGVSLRNVSLKLENTKSYSLGEIAHGQKKKAFAHPGGDSSLQLEFDDAQGVQHSAILSGYVTGGECDDLSAQVLQDFRVSVRHDGGALWKSWYGFL